MDAPTAPAPAATTTRPSGQSATALTAAKTSTPRAETPAPNIGVWSTEEHERYLQAKFANPKASWKEIARLVGTRSARQVILHDQKFRAKMDRRRSKFERAMTPRCGTTPTTTTPTSATTTRGNEVAPAAPNEMRYFDSMGVLLLASVASSRIPKIHASGEAAQPVETVEEDTQ